LLTYCPHVDAVMVYSLYGGDVQLPELCPVAMATFGELNADRDPKISNRAANFIYKAYK